MAITTDDVQTAFQLMRGRDATIDQVAAYQQQCASVDDLRREILSSRSFQDEVLGKIIQLCKPLGWPAHSVEVDVPEPLLRQMIERSERNYSHLGQTEPHWSVLSAEHYRASNINQTRGSFSPRGNTTSRCFAP